ncbi:hypothetical protein [Klebsiella variicola]|uniref:hypothetical protein n=1 Tax=Klebsiella variicola TaxID=244366 RepID=UPI0021811092|nr:hypothetical protein [Klebsiella variicola]GKK31273.1 hypothetical protein NUKP39_19980 [Klebsiella variicola]HCI8794511.1 hypothetical protein [Klebsiella variicola]
MKATLQKVKEGIAAALLGKTPEQLADEQRKEAVKTAVDNYLIRNPDWKPSTKTAPVKDTKLKGKRIMKTLGAGAGGFTQHIAEDEALLRARAKCRKIIASDPERYSHIIESAPLRDLLGV